MQRNRLLDQAAYKRDVLLDACTACASPSPLVPAC